MLKHLLVRSLSRLFLLCLVIVTSFFVFPSIRAQAGGGDCPLRAYYVAPAIVTVQYPASGDGIDIYWTPCDTYHEEGAAYYQVSVEQTGQVITPSWYYSSSGQMIGWQFPRPLIPESSYSFRVRECFSDGTCTLFSQASYPIAAPTGWGGRHRFF